MPVVAKYAPILVVLGVVHRELAVFRPGNVTGTLYTTGQGPELPGSWIKTSTNAYSRENDIGFDPMALPMTSFELPRNKKSDGVVTGALCVAVL